MLKLKTALIVLTALTLTGCSAAYEEALFKSNFKRSRAVIMQSYSFFSQLGWEGTITDPCGNGFDCKDANYTLTANKKPVSVKEFDAASECNDISNISERDYKAVGWAKEGDYPNWNAWNAKEFIAACTETISQAIAVQKEASVDFVANSPIIRVLLDVSEEESIAPATMDFQRYDYKEGVRMRLTLRTLFGEESNSKG